MITFFTVDLLISSFLLSAFTNCTVKIKAYTKNASIMTLDAFISFYLNAFG